MAVEKSKTAAIHKVAGVRLSAVEANVRYADRLDLVLIEIAENATTAGVFTQNAFCAAPVEISKQHLHSVSPRYFLINTGNANAGTGEQGKVAALRCCQAIAELTGVGLASVLPFSTGVIGEDLPTDKILLGLPDAYTNLAEDNWQRASEGILTTDTRPKLMSVQIEIEGEVVTITGMAKGSGMIKPNMATMLSFIFTDAKINPPLLAELLDTAVSRSFNRITVDGDTSTNDCCILVATGAKEVEVTKTNTESYRILSEALNDLFVDLAKDIIRDAEGASKFITINVLEGASSDECLQVAYTVAESPLVKTAFFASDPNWGRILAAVGRAGIKQMNLGLVKILLGTTAVVSNGGLDANYSEEQGQAEMDRDEISITICLGRGDHQETVWTSDLSHEYVRINADYRS